jgi:transposase
MKRYIGLDVHRLMIEACFIDETGRVLRRVRLACTREAIAKFAQSALLPTDHVALEATTNTWSVADLLCPYVARVVIGNPLRTRVIAEARIKTDKIDAEVLAQLLRCDFLPAVWHPDEATRQLRELSGHRAAVVRQQTRLKNRILSLLAQRLIVPPQSDVFGKSGREWLKTVNVSVADRLVIDGQVGLLMQLEAEEVKLTTELAKLSYSREDVRLLLTLPGVGPAVAQAVIGALGDWRRFHDADHAASYLGLAPTVHQSAANCHYGSISKAGNSHARWLLTQAAQQVGSHPGPLGVFFRRLAARKHRNIAVVATARKLVTVAYYMLKNREPYRYAVPARTQFKLSSLRVAATGIRRPKGKIGRPLEAQPVGLRVRRTPNLNSVYAAEGLPSVPIEAVSAGEQQVIERCGGARLLDKIHRATVRYSRRRGTLTNPGPKDTLPLPTKHEPGSASGIAGTFLGSSGESRSVTELL